MPDPMSSDADRSASSAPEQGAGAQVTVAQVTVVQVNPPERTQTSPSAPRAGEEDDPLAHLAKMSTTAGVGSQDYVAVNLAAIVAALLGLASVLAILNGSWLVIPAAGVVCAIVAWRQIRNSNGTQTGNGVALIGMVLSLLIGGGVLAAMAVHAMAEHREEQGVAAALRDLGQDLSAGRYHEAYTRFSDRFHERVPEERFTEIWETAIAKNMALGRVKTLKWNDRAIFDDDAGTGRRVAMAGAIAEFEKPLNPPPRWDVRLSKARGSDQWQIEDIQQVFPQKPGPKKR
jgi:hypothetical protein